jgi:predicted cobalt transporter CbtA
MDGYLREGAVAGLVGGAVYGAYVALVGTPLVAHAEHLAGHGGDGGHDHAGEGAGLVAEGTVQTVSAAGSVALGLLLGLVVFGVAAYLLEPALPETGGSYLLGLCGFLAVSGVPWLVLPPAVPGAESSLPTTAALSLYAGLVVVGAGACVAAGTAYRRLATRSRPIAGGGALGVFGVVVGTAVFLAPAVTYEAGVPGDLQAAYTGVVVVGQLLLWGVAATVHGRLSRRTVDADPTVRPTSAD